ncbi:MAG: hypothetical protein AVDCRST_MAG64-4430, partial [uncultured Phycisphaerae bacterium]
HRDPIRRLPVDFEAALHLAAAV